MKKKRPDLAEDESDMDDEFMERHEEELLEKAIEAAKKKWEKEIVKLEEEKEEKKPKAVLDERLKEIKAEFKELAKERRTRKVEPRKNSESRARLTVRLLGLYASGKRRCGRVADAHASDGRTIRAFRATIRRSSWRRFSFAPVHREGRACFRDSETPRVVSCPISIHVVMGASADENSDRGEVAGADREDGR